MAILTTNSGKFFDFNDIENNVIDINDIAHALSRLCRFNGHIDRFYSVADHSLRVSYIVPEKYALEALLHDAAEAYLGDVTTPLKSFLPDYRLLETAVESKISSTFGLLSDAKLNVKIADKIMLHTETRDLFDTPREYDDSIALLDKIEPFCADDAKKYFLKRFQQLQNGRQKCQFMTLRTLRLVSN
jgi:5'-deoxynucleotidase YfbR-like HD superfamily hydrolase